jgi:hypothetical protein
MDLAVPRGHRAAVTLDHGRDLLALVRMDDETNFVVSHALSLWMKAARFDRRCDAANASAAGLIKLSKTNDREGGRRSG